MGPLDLANYVQQQGQMGRERGTNTRLNQLAGQAYGANPQDQRGLVQQAIQTDRGQGMALGGALDKDHETRTSRAAQKVGMFVKVYKANPQMASGMYPGIAQEVGQLFPEMQIPQEFSPEFLPGLEQFAASMGGGAEGEDLKSLRIGANGNYWAIRGGQFVDTGTAAAPTNQIFDTGNGVVGIDKRTLGASPVMIGGQPQQGAPQPTQQRAPGEVPFSIDPSLPASVQASIRANEGQWAGAPEGGQIDIPQQGQPQGGQLRTAPKPASVSDALAIQRFGAAQARRLSPAEVAQAGYRPGTIVQVDGFGGEKVLQTPPTDRAASSETDRKTVNAARAKIPQLQNAIRGLDRIDAALTALSGSMVDTGPIDGKIQRFTPAGQELDAAVGGIQNSFLALTRVPGIGSQSDLEARIAALQYPSLDKAPDVNKRTMENLKLFARDLAKAYEMAVQGGSAPAPAPAPDDDDALIGKYL